MSDYYNTIAPSYDELHGDEQLEKIRTCVQFIEPGHDEKLLDVGCGTGISTEPWSCRSYGIDPSEELVKIAKKKRQNSDYKVASAEDIPFEDGYFDYIISITAIQNFSEIPRSLSEMRRVLKKGGHIIVSTLKDSPKIKDIEKAMENKFQLDKIYEGRIDRFYIGTEK